MYWYSQTGVAAVTALWTTTTYVYMIHYFISPDVSPSRPLARAYPVGRPVLQDVRVHGEYVTCRPEHSTPEDQREVAQCLRFFISNRDVMTSVSGHVRVQRGRHMGQVFIAETRKKGRVDVHFGGITQHRIKVQYQLSSNPPELNTATKTYGLQHTRIHPTTTSLSTAQKDQHGTIRQKHAHARSDAPPTLPVAAAHLHGTDAYPGSLVLAEGDRQQHRTVPDGRSLSEEGVLAQSLDSLFSELRAEDVEVGAHRRQHLGGPLQGRKNSVERTRNQRIISVCPCHDRLLQGLLS